MPPLRRGDSGSSSAEGPGGQRAPRFYVGVSGAPDLRKGAHKRYLSLLQQLAARGHRVVFATPLVDVGPRVQRIAIPAWRSRLRLTRALETAAAVLLRIGAIRRAARGADAVLVFGSIHLLAGVVLKKSLGTALVYGVRSDWVIARQRAWEGAGRKNSVLNVAYVHIFQAIERACLLAVDRVVVQNGEDAQNIEKRYGLKGDTIEILPNNVDPAWLASYGAEGLTNSSQSLRKLVFVGSLIPLKGLMILLQALARCEAPGLTLDVIGEGPLQAEAEAFVRAQGLASAVTFHGFLEQPLARIAASDLLVVPSLFDSCPNVVLEALLVGTPVIGSATGGIREILRHEELLFPIGDVEALACTIRGLSEPEAYVRAKALCQERKAPFTFDWVARFDALIESAIRETRKAPPMRIAQQDPSAPGNVAGEDRK